MTSNDKSDRTILQPVFLDTETTGLDEQAEIVEIAILALDGACLLSTYIRPSIPLTSAAMAVHGITEEILANAPSWPEVAPQVFTFLNGQTVVAHNADFDARMLAQTNQRYGLTCPDPRNWICTMKMLTAGNNGRWPSLPRAMAMSGLELTTRDSGTLHQAGFDAECCRRIWIAHTLKRVAVTGLSH